MTSFTMALMLTVFVLLRPRSPAGQILRSWTSRSEAIDNLLYELADVGIAANVVGGVSPEWGSWLSPPVR